MGLTAKIITYVTLKNRSNGLKLTNKSINEEFENTTIHGLLVDGDAYECDAVIVDEIVDGIDGVQVDLYKRNKGIDFHLIKTSLKEIPSNSVLKIDNILYLLINSKRGANLYSGDLNEFYFEEDLKGIQEISNYLLSNNIKFEVYLIRN